MNRHLIYTNGRSGSNAFVNLLNQHPQVVNYGEVLGEWTHPGRYIRPMFRGPDAPARYLDFTYRSRVAFDGGQWWSYARNRRLGRPTHFRRRSDVQSLGIKEFAVNFRRFGLEDYIVDRPDLRLVVLLRENTIARYLSVKRLETNHLVASVDAVDGSSHRGFRIEPETLIEELDVIEAENQLLRDAVRDHRGPIMDIRYEDYFQQGAQAQLDVTLTLQEFLGVEPLELQTHHERLQHGSVTDSIENYADFREAIRSTPYEHWLEGL